MVLGGKHIVRVRFSVSLTGLLSFGFFSPQSFAIKCRDDFKEVYSVSLRPRFVHNFQEIDLPVARLSPELKAALSLLDLPRDYLLRALKVESATRYGDSKVAVDLLIGNNAFRRTMVLNPVQLQELFPMIEPSQLNLAQSSYVPTLAGTHDLSTMPMQKLRIGGASAILVADSARQVERSLQPKASLPSQTPKRAQRLAKRAGRGVAALLVLGTGTYYLLSPQETQMTDYSLPQKIRVAEIEENATEVFEDGKRIQVAEKFSGQIVVTKDREVLVHPKTTEKELVEFLEKNPEYGELEFVSRDDLVD